MSSPDLRRPWTVAGLDELPEDEFRYELIDGHLVVTPPAIRDHQELSHRLRELLTGSEDSGWRARIEMSVVLDVDALRIPDVVAYRWPLSVDGKLVNAVDVGLVVEVVSASSRRTDRFAKPGEYADAGIACFWRVETEPRAVLHGYRLQEGRYEQVAEVSERGELPTPWGAVAVDVPALLYDL